MSFGTHRQYNVTLTAAAEGFGLGSALAFGIGYMARNRPIIQRLPLAIRTSLVASSGVMLGVIYADKAGIDFEGARIARTQGTKLEQEWENLSTFDKVITYAKENRFKVVLGSWLGSMGVSWLYIHSQPLTTAQKLVQARVWAQGLTVASMLGMAAITTIQTKGDKYLENQKQESQNSHYAEKSHIAEAKHNEQLNAAKIHQSEEQGAEKSEKEESEK